MEETPELSVSSFEIVNWFLLIIVGLLILALIVGVIYAYRSRKKEQSTVDQPKLPVASKHLLTEMEKAAKRGEYKLAIQKCFQYLLTRFSEKTDLLFAATKTNGEYRRDVQQKYPAGAKRFHDLSLYFDEVWYGEKKVGPKEYQQYRQDVLRFLGEVESVEK